MAKKKTRSKSKTKLDNLTKLEGIGPAIQKALHANGIDSYRKLAKASQKKLKQILEGVRGTHDPTTWPEQAALARDGKWTELKAWQSQLDGGKTPESKENRRKGKIPKRSTNLKSEGVAKTASVVFTAEDGGAYDCHMPFKIERILTDHEAEQEYLARKEELDDSIEKARTAISELLEPRSKPNKKRMAKKGPPDQLCSLIDKQIVTGISASFRTKFGQPISPLEVVIAINVRRKRPVEELPKRDVLPKEFKGVQIKVIEGTFHVLSGVNASLLRGSTSPANALPFDEEILGGIPIAPKNAQNDFGTLGILTKKENSLLGLTCQHVVKGGINDEILQLGPGNVMPREAFRTKGIVQPSDRDVKFADVVESVDCACVTIDPDGTAVLQPPDGTWTRELSTPNNNSVPLVYGNRDLIPEDVGIPLWKFGNGTGEKLKGRLGILRHGEIFLDGVGYKNNFTIRRFEDSGRGFVLPGDSGSMVAMEAQAQIGNSFKDCFVAIGILFASLGDTTVGFGCTMVRVLKALGLENQVPTVEDWFPR